MLSLWVLIVVAFGAGFGSVEFRTQQQCETARTVLYTADTTKQVVAVCAQKTVGGP